MSTELLDPILDRVNRAFCWIKTEDGPRRIDEPLTAQHVARHLSGRAMFGACPLGQGESTVRLALLDFDSHKGETSPEAMAGVVIGVMEKCEMLGLAPIPFRSSGGNGVHLFFLWQEPQDAYSVRQRLTHLLNLCNLKPGTGGVAANQVEIFPKQDSVLPTGYGSMFLLPLCGKSVRLGVKDVEG
jgi:hypothetical protein